MRCPGKQRVVGDLKFEVCFDTRDPEAGVANSGETSIGTSLCDSAHLPNLAGRSPTGGKNDPIAELCK